MAETKDKADVVRGDVVEVLKQIRKGDLLYELNAELEKVVSGVKETSKGGTVTLKITVAPLKKGSAMLNVGGEVSAKIPRPEHDASIFYPTKDNTLQRNDPNQMDLEL